MQTELDLPSNHQLSKPPLGCAVFVLLGAIALASNILPFTRFLAPFPLLAGAIVLGWWGSPRTNRTRRWPIGIGIALSVLSFPLWELALWRWFDVWQPIVGILGAALLAFAYSRLDRPAPHEPSWRDDLQSLSDAAEAAQRRVRLPLPALWAIVAIHALTFPLVLGYTLQPCTWLDPIRRIAGCQRALTLPPRTVDLEFSAHGAIAASITSTPDPQQAGIDDVEAWQRAILAEPQIASLWNIGTGSLVQQFNNPARILSFSLGTDGQTIATAGGDRVLRVWRVGDRSSPQTLSADDRLIGHIALAHDGSKLAALDEQNDAIYVWSLPDGALRYQTSLENVADFAFSPDGELLALIDSNDATLLHTRDYATIWTQQHDAFVTSGEPSIAFSPDGQTLAIASTLIEPTVSLWRVSDGQPLHMLDASALGDARINRMRITDVAFSPDGNRIAAVVSIMGDANNVIAVWRVSDGALIQHLNTLDPIDAIAFSPDGSRLLVEHRSDVYSLSVRVN
jgi:hypothetical protein